MIEAGSLHVPRNWLKSPRETDGRLAAGSAGVIWRGRVSLGKCGRTRRGRSSELGGTDVGCEGRWL